VKSSESSSILLLDLALEMSFGVSPSTNFQMIKISRREEFNQINELNKKTKELKSDLDKINRQMNEIRSEWGNL